MNVHIEGHAQDVAYAQWRGQPDGPSALERQSGQRSTERPSRTRRYFRRQRANRSCSRYSERPTDPHRDGSRTRPFGQSVSERPLQNLRASRAQLALDTLVFQYGRARVASHTFSGARQRGHSHSSSGAPAYVGRPAAPGGYGHRRHPIHQRGLAANQSANAHASPERRTGTGHIGLSGTPARPQAAGWIDLRAVSVDTLLLGDMRADWSLRDTLRANAVLRQRAQTGCTAGRGLARRSARSVQCPRPHCAARRYALRARPYLCAEPTSARPAEPALRSEPPL